MSPRGLSPHGNVIGRDEDTREHILQCKKCRAIFRRKIQGGATPYLCPKCRAASPIKRQRGGQRLPPEEKARRQRERERLRAEKAALRAKELARKKKQRAVFLQLKAQQKAANGRRRKGSSTPSRRPRARQVTSPVTTESSPPPRREGAGDVGFSLWTHDDGRLDT